LSWDPYGVKRSGNLPYVWNVMYVWYGKLYLHVKLLQFYIHKQKVYLYGNTSCIMLHNSVKPSKKAVGSAGTIKQHVELLYVLHIKHIISILEIYYICTYTCKPKPRNTCIYRSTYFLSRAELILPIAYIYRTITFLTYAWIKFYLYRKTFLTAISI
jgi:hypothetical protein